MKPAAFQYEAPTTLDDAIAAIADGADAKVLAGGQSLIPMLSMRLTSFDTLVDLRRIAELHSVDIGDNEVRLGAMVVQADVERNDAICSAIPLLPLALAHVGHFQIRNRGTVGGSIAHADPAAELPAVALALDAVMEIAGPSGRREVVARNFFESTFETAITDGEILAAVRFPRWAGTSGFAVEEVGRRHGDFALLGAVCGIAVDGDTVTRGAIGMFGLGPTPLRADSAEAALVGAAVGAIDVDHVGRLATEDLDPTGDIHASGAYRKAVGANVVSSCVAKALEEALK